MPTTSSALFEKPNQFEYPPDGYCVQIEAAYPADYPPTLTAVSACFPGRLRQDGVPAPTVIHQTARELTFDWHALRA